MEYDLNEITTIPIIVCPTEDKCKRIYQQSFLKRNILVFPYEPQRLRAEIFKDSESPKAFIYRVTYSLLAYICLKLLLEN